MKTILIIDDETDLCFLLRAYLKIKHHEVIIANSLVDGLCKIKSFHPDILFLDNNLPDGHGWDQACEIADNFPEIKINLMTGQPDIRLEPCEIQFYVIEKPLSYLKVDRSLN